MRDKVKRFLSILMTALMLVNLLPVGALAEGVMISNSVQSKVSLTADSGTAPIETGHVYVYVKIDGASPETLAKFKLNSSGWYTIGSIAKTMPGKGEWEPYWYGGGEWVITPTPSDTKTYQPGDNTGAGVLPAYSIVGLKPWEDNKLIPLGNVRWTGYKLTTGANNYQPESIFSWHMDGIVNFKEINVPYTVKHVVKDSSPEIVLKEETKNQKYGQMTDATMLKFEGYKHVGKIENQIIGDDPITIYVYYEPDKKQTVDVTYKTSEGGTITNGRTYKIQPVTGNLSGGGRLPSSTPTADVGYEFVGWERDDGQTYNDLNDVYSKLNQKTADAGTYTLYQNTTFTAKFKKNSYKLKINYVYEDGSEAAKSHEATLPYQSEYNVESPVIDGYTADKLDVRGTMPANDVEVTVTYTKNSYNLKINYVYEDGSKAAESHEDTLSYQSDYSVTSPDITGYKADKLDVSGKMPANDVEETVTYTKNSYKLKINYVYEDGSEAAASHKAEFPYQSDYSVESPVIEGYTANNLVVSGTMPAGNVEVTVTYTKNSYSYTVEHYWIGDKDKLDAQPFHTDADENQTALFDSAVAYQENGASWVIRTNPVYTFAKADPEKITITSDPSKNVLKLYYYKNVKLTANSDTLPYNGKEQHVFGYTCAVAEMKDGRVEYVPWTGEKPLTFEGVSASGLGKDVNKDGYRVEFNETPIGETDGLYYVNESQTGTLTITPAPVTLQAPIASKTYDGEPLKAEDYVHSYVEGVNFADDFAAVILTGSQTLVGSSSSLITEVIPKEGKKLTNYNFTFVPGTLTVTDGTGDDPVVPAKVITKTHIPKDLGYNLGETVTFTVSVKNIYNEQKEVTLEEQPGVTFVDPQGAAIGTKATKTLEPGETWEIQATYTITSDDILAGGFTNKVKAIFSNKSWTAKDKVTTAKLDTTLNVTKTSDVPDGQKAALGQTITYTIKVQNAGNVPYTNVKVEDPLTGLTETIETLAVGETKTFTTEYVVTEADVLEGHVLNTATATGDKIKDPKSDEPKEPNGGDEVETPTFSPITIKPKDVTATYNGAAITGKDVEITSGKLLEGHKLSAAVIGSGVNAGSYELTIDPEKITIVDANNKDVSEMYARTILPGKLIINKRSVLITSQSATKTYDGSALTRPAVTITGDGFVPGELAKAEATGSITNVGSTPNTIRYTTTGAFNAANYSIALSVGTLTVTEKPKPEPRRTFNLTINYVYQNGKRAAASYNRGGLKNGETFDITSPVIAGYTASETVVSGTIYNRDIKVTVIYTADGVNLDDYGVPLGLGNITMNVGDCFE